jgi:molecular chaperone GrpE
MKKEADKKHEHSHSHSHKHEHGPKHEETPVVENPEVLPPEEPAAEPDPLEAAQKQIAELKDRLLRAQAEWDNSRKRILREKEDAVRYAGEALLEKLLPVLDNFEMGMQAAKTATDPKAIVQGLDMVQSQFQQVLKDAGVETIDAVGHPFDPHRHEALGHLESADQPEGHVLTQMRKGYKLKDRLLRPASVFVAKPPEDKAHSKA